MKPSFATLKANHNSSTEGKAGYVSGAAVYEEIGYDINKLMGENAGYRNTCAARMSLALIKSGFGLRGRIKIKAGPHAGKSIEPGAKLLADQLLTTLGRPLILTQTAKAPDLLKGKRGIVFFWKIEGYDGGHIDLIEPANTTLVCNSQCYFACREIWFWELD